MNFEFQLIGKEPMSFYVLDDILYYGIYFMGDADQMCVGAIDTKKYENVWNRIFFISEYAHSHWPVAFHDHVKGVLATSDTLLMLWHN